MGKHSLSLIYRNLKIVSHKKGKKYEKIRKLLNVKISSNKNKNNNKLVEKMSRSQISVDVDWVNWTQMSVKS